MNNRLCKKIGLFVVAILLSVLLFPNLSQAQIGDMPKFLELNEITKEYEYQASDFGIHFIGIFSLSNIVRETSILYEFGFSLHIDFFYIEILLDYETDSDLANNHRNWTSLRQFISKIQSISYGVYNETMFYAYIGEIFDFNAGFGTIIKNYTNSLQSPLIEGVGGHFSFDYKDFVRFEFMTADFITPDLFASYIYVKPLKFLDIGVYSEIEVGGTVAFDVDPYRVPYYNFDNEPAVNEYGTTPVIDEDWNIYLDYDGTDPGIENITGWSAYVKAPIYQFDYVDFFVFFEFAQEVSLGNAYRFGLNGNIFNRTTEYRIEFIAYDRGFVPSLFFTQYDTRKINRYKLGIKNKSDASGTPFGIYIELGKEYKANMLGFKVSFEDYFDDEIEGEITIRFYIKEFVKNLGIEILINKWDLGYGSFGEIFMETWDKTMWYIKFYWWLTPNAQFSITAQNFFLIEDGFITKQHQFKLSAKIYI